MDTKAKKISLLYKIGLLMIMAVGLLSATGYLSYRKLSSIVSSINVDINPELRLVSIRDISMALEKAQNSIRIYTITNETQDLQPYYTVISNIDEKVSRLRKECTGDTTLLQQTDTISKLIEESIVIWNKLLYLNNNQTVVKYLKNLSDRLNSGPDEVLQTENGILKRVFKRNNNNRLSEVELKSDLQEIELQDRITKERIMTREAQLASTSSELKEQFYDLITKIENEISGIVKEKASDAQQQAQETYLWLALFLVSGTLLAILVMFIIVRFVRKTEDYQIALQKSKDETEELIKTKELFMANMSHEIRTPVTAISGFTEQLLHEPFDEITSRTLRVIKSSSDHLSKIINDILDFSKLQNGKLVLENVHFKISKVFEDVYALFDVQAKREDTELSFSVSPDVPSVLLGDPYRLKQILINLVSNSVKFTTNGKVHYSAKANTIELPEIELILEVVDNGIGIDEKKLSSVFEDFIQEEMSTTRKFGGTGLGLSIVKKLVDLHKGTIECISKKDHGTRITCNIPYREGDEEKILSDIKPPLFIPDEIKNLKILVVDDEEYNRMLFRMILERWGIEFREASGGNEALEILQNEQFNLIFMDARMPGIDGLKTTQIIRQELNLSTDDIPVICISAASVKEDWQQYEDAGMNTFLSKPFSEEALLTTIMSVLNNVLPAIPENSKTEGMTREVKGKINLENLYHLSAGDEKFVNQMIESFKETTANGLREIDKAVQDNKWEDISDLAHKLLPPCRHIGVSNLTVILEQIEEKSKDESNSDLVKMLIENAEQEYEHVKDLLKEHVTKIT